MRASSGLAPTIWQPLILRELHGRIAAPTFFWGGETTRATGNLLYANRLILMGVWRDPSQPGTEETGAQLLLSDTEIQNRLLRQSWVIVAHLTPAR
jgi:hypothetical protein